MEPPSPHTLSILNRSERSCPSQEIRRAVEAALTLEQAPPSEINVLLTSDEHVQELNSKFRNLDETTDVLTFPSGEGASGDIAIAYGVATRQADARGVPVDAEIVTLAIHGALHLTGLDDETEHDRAEMVRRMGRVALELGMEPDEEWYSLLHCPSHPIEVIL